MDPQLSAEETNKGAEAIGRECSPAMARFSVAVVVGGEKESAKYIRFDSQQQIRGGKTSMVDPSRGESAEHSKQISPFSGHGRLASWYRRKGIDQYHSCVSLLRIARVRPAEAGKCRSHQFNRLVVQRTPIDALEGIIILR